MPDWLRRYLQPREGWLSAFLLLVMLLSLCWSVQRGGWLQQADFLLPVACLRHVAGHPARPDHLSVVAVLPISALMGGAGRAVGSRRRVLPESAERFTAVGPARRGDRLDPDPDRSGVRAAAEPYAVGLAVIMWVTAFIAAYTLYRHHRSWTPSCSLARP